MQRPAGAGASEAGAARHRGASWVAGAALATILLSSCAPGPAIPVDGASMAATVSWIAGHHPSRLAGSAQESATASWLEGQFRSLGLEVGREAFPVLGFSCGAASFSLEGGEPLPVQSFLYSPPTPAAGLVAPLIDAGWGLETDLGAARDRIVVLHRRGTGLLEAAEAASRAGALGIVVLDPGRPSSQGFVGTGLPLPMAELGGSEARRLALALGDSPGRKGDPALMGRLILGTRSATSISHNVIARLPGTASSGPRSSILVGAHIDSVATPGAEDNASGLACLLSVAAALVRVDPAEGGPRPDIYLVGFGAEEVGEVGSRALVEAWRGREPGAALILDTVGSGKLTMIYSLRAEANAVTLASARAARDLGLRVEGGGSENSDHLPFALAGIPAAFLMRLPEERRHTAQDRPEFVEAAALEETRDLTLATLGLLVSGGPAPAPGKGP